MVGYSHVVGICRDISLEALEVLFPLLVLLQIALEKQNTRLHCYEVNTQNTNAA